jgi:biopolymer transport protein ExbD
VKVLAIALAILALTAGALRADDTARLVVMITKEGKLYVGGAALDSDEELKRKLRRWSADHKDPAIAVAADVAAPKERTAFVIEEAKRAGIKKIQIVTAPPDKSGKPKP